MADKSRKATKTRVGRRSGDLVETQLNKRRAYIKDVKGAALAQARRRALEAPPVEEDVVKPRKQALSESDLNTTWSRTYRNKDA